MATQENHVDVVSYLLANGASQDITTEVYTLFYLWSIWLLCVLRK